MARAPEVFDLAPQTQGEPRTRPAITVVETEDAFSGSDIPPEALDEVRGSPWLKVFTGAFFGFLSLAFSVWAYGFVAALVAANPVLGFAAMVLAIVALLALVVLIVREVAAVWKLGSVVKLRAAADDAFASHDRGKAKAFIDSIVAFYAKDAGSARARAALTEHARAIIDPPDLVNLAEREMLRAKDNEARAAIASAASKVAMVTTISPRAWVDIGFVLAQSVRLIRRIATIYSGRPGGLALWRLSARVATHLAITGGIAVAHDAIGQVLGAGLVARLSSKLGEGVLNGVLTARVGLSAIAVCRPMPFRALEAPGLSEVAGSLMTGKTVEKSAG